MHLQLRTKFVIPIIILFLIGIFLSSYITVHTSISVLKSVSYEQIEQTAETIATNLSEWIKRNKMDFSRWAQDDIFLDAIPPTFLGKAARRAANPMLEKFLKKYQFYESILLCSGKGEVIVASHKFFIGNRISSINQYLQTISQKTIFVSGIRPSRVTGEPVFTIAAPVGPFQAPQGVLVGTVKLDYFTANYLEDLKFGKTGYAFMVDQTGVVVAHPDKHRLFTEAPGWVLETDAPDVSDHSGLLDKERIEVVSAGRELGLKICITAFVEEILAPVKIIRQRVTILTLIVSVLVVSLVAWIVTRFVTTPIRTFVQSMKTVAAGDLDKKIRLETADEFSSMAGSFNEMAAALKESKHKLKQTYEQLVRKERMAALGELTARIAHGIKNPLGIIKGSAQILVDDSEEPEVKNEVARYVIEEVDHLSIRIEELLHYAKPMPLNLEPVDLNQILEERIQFWESQSAELKKVNVLRKLDLGLPPLQLDKRLIRQLIMNMVINACEAMPEGGSLIIQTQAPGQTKERHDKNAGSKGVLLSFEDQGSGISPDHLQKIFDPFFTTKERGTGLGLSEVYRIVEKHQAEIWVKSSGNKGACFLIRFSLASKTGEDNVRQ
ncbi:MAG: HAMP domain-containing protein [Desulfohalobiaceae bacterium]|nr:HAMP domain-containing protein [Desulfohalobiaceae bacterium]